MEYIQKQRNKYSNLMPYHEVTVEENGQMVNKLVPDVQNRELRIPANIQAYCQLRSLLRMENV